MKASMLPAEVSAKVPKLATVWKLPASKTSPATSEVIARPLSETALPACNAQLTVPVPSTPATKTSLPPVLVKLIEPKVTVHLK